jgi:hypothetical protein
VNIKVFITDENHPNFSYDRMRLYFIDAAIWATRFCSSYKRFHIQDVSETSDLHDQIAEYEFADERDALMFTIKWK